MAGRIGSKRVQALMSKASGDTEIAGGALSVDSAGVVEVKTTSTPKFVLERTNPGASHTTAIYETTIDLSSSTRRYAIGRPTNHNGTTVFSSSFAIPQYSIINAVGVYLPSKLSGTLVPGGPGGMNFISKIGLTQSADGGGYSQSSSISQPQYFMSSSHYVDGTRMILSASGDNAVIFSPPQGFYSSSAGGGWQNINPTEGPSEYYAAITSSNICLSVTLASASNQTGSIRLAIFAETFKAPTA